MEKNPTYQPILFALNAKKTRTFAHLNVDNSALEQLPEQVATAPVSIREPYAGDVAEW